MAEELEMHMVDEGGIAVLEIAGELDLSRANELAENLAALTIGGGSFAVVDLTAVEFLDSTALGVLVHAQRTARTKGGELHLVVERTHVRKVFEITGLDTVFPISATREEALA